MTEDSSAEIGLVLSFARHCMWRAVFVKRAIKRCKSFEEMVASLSPPAAAGSSSSEAIPEAWITGIGEFCAFLFPVLWGRRCLFRSLLILDWAHRRGIRPELNVGMQLGSDRDQGHCWLSRGDRLFCEAGGWPERYGALFHSGRGVSYWTALSEETLESNAAQRPAP